MNIFGKWKSLFFFIVWDSLKFSFETGLLERFYSSSDIVEISEGATIGFFIFRQIFVPVGKFSRALFDKGRYTRPLRL